MFEVGSPGFGGRGRYADHQPHGNRRQEDDPCDAVESVPSTVQLAIPLDPAYPVRSAFRTQERGSETRP
jgi:hypothetical protein